MPLVFLFTAAFASTAISLNFPTEQQRRRRRSRNLVNFISLFYFFSAASSSAYLANQLTTRAATAATVIQSIKHKAKRYLRTNFLMNCLLKMLCIDNGTYFTGRVGGPVGCHNFNLRFACIDAVCVSVWGKSC